MTTTSHTIAVSRHTWTYLTAGSPENDALILLHGGGGNAASLFRYSEAFAERFYVIVPDVPRSVRNMEDAVQGVRAILAATEQQAAHIVGFAFGAALAQMFIRRFPNSVRDLVLTHATIPSQHLAEKSAMQLSLLRWYPAPILMRLMRRAYRRDLQQSGTPASADERAFWQEYYEGLYRDDITKRDLLARARLTKDYHHSPPFKSNDLNYWYGDLLIIESSADQVINAGDRGALKGMYPRAYVQTLEGYDHLAPILASAEMSRSISKFLLRDEDEYE